MGKLIHLDEHRATQERPIVIADSSLAAEPPSIKTPIGKIMWQDVGLGLGIGVIAGAIVGAEKAEAIPHALLVDYCRDGVALQVHQTLDHMVRTLTEQRTADPVLDFVLNRKVAMVLGAVQGLLAGAFGGTIHATVQKIKNLIRAA